MIELVISETFIRQDDEGRYCLNDLHKASGGRPEHRPGHFLRNKQTKALIKEMGGAQICASVIHGDGGGTFAAKELIYAYAMWISAAFALKVIRGYDSMVQAQMDKLNTLSMRRARAEVEFIEAQMDASRCGLGLRRWRDEKPMLEGRIAALQLESQPSLFLLN